MDDPEPRPIDGSDDAAYPFWSPDSRWIGFFADGQIKKVLAAGGPAQIITALPGITRGATWNAEDVILFSDSSGRISRVSASSGGPIAGVTVLQQDRQETHRWPYFLPDGRHFLYLARSGLPDQSGVYVGSLDGRVKQRLLASNWAAVYGAGHLLYMQANTLMARPFDLSSLQLSGEQVVVAERVGNSTGGFAGLSASHTGTLAYSPLTLDIGKLTWVERSEKIGTTVGGDAGYLDFRLSPNEQRLAVTIVDPSTSMPDIWLTDLTRANASDKLTSNPWMDSGPVWSPDGTRIAFRSAPSGVGTFFVKSAGGGGNEQPLLPDFDGLLEQFLAFGGASATDWKGNYILYAVNQPKTGLDLWLLDLATRKPVPYLKDANDQLHGTFSPDGRFIAYSSDETGRFEVYVQTFPRSDRRWKISLNGGVEPRWSGDGSELFFLSEDLELMSTQIVQAPTFTPGTPQRLFQTQVPEGVSRYRNRYEVSKDGKRFLVFMQTNRSAPTGITTVLNWTAGLQQARR
jgi:Tol biopolymer transport system component